MAEKKKARRVPVDVNRLDLDLDSDELRELLDVPQDVWAEMSDAQKILLFTQRGINASRAALRGEKYEP